jgi:serine/threonine protein kinase
MYYGDTQASTYLSSLLLHEAKVCKILRASPHPNIVRYLGCVVENDRVTGLCFVKYDMILSEGPSKLDLLQQIQKGIRHLHSLGLIHCDIKPANILMKGEIPSIGDFDSCQREEKFWVSRQG